MLAKKPSVLLFCAAVLGVYALEARQLGMFLIDSLNGKPASQRLTGLPMSVLHIIAGVGLLCIAWGYFIERRWIKLTRISLRTPKLKRTALRIAHITDLQCDRLSCNARKLPGLINPLQPDLIVFTGDALNSATGLPRFKETLGALEARIGKFAVRGNIEDNRFPDTDLFGGTGFHHLSAESVELEKDGETFRVSGLDFARAGELRTALGGIPPDAYSLFLFHTPDLIEDLAGLGVDLYLCGHTRGGQVRMPFYGALVTLSRFGKRHEAGRYTVGRTTLYVSRGVGLERLPAPRVRFLCRPEVAVFDLSPADSGV